MIFEKLFAQAKLACYLAGMNKQSMYERLKTAYPDSTIEVIDLTGTEDHWEVFIESTQFKGQNRIKQHQSVMAVFAPELKTGEVHALSITTKIKD